MVRGPAGETYLLENRALRKSPSTNKDVKREQPFACAQLRSTLAGFVDLG